MKPLSQTPGLALKRSARKPPFSGLYQLQCNISAPPSMTFQFSILGTLQPSLLRPWEIVMAIFHPKSGLLESSPARSPVFCYDCITSHYIQSPAAIHQGPDSNILHILISQDFFSNHSTSTVFTSPSLFSPSNSPEYTLGQETNP